MKIPRRASVLAAAGALLTCLAAVMPNTANAATGGNFRTYINGDWSGYSAAPAHGNVTVAGAAWTVPQVSCPSSGSPRAAVWVGMWGTTESVNNGTAWLPQIGTQSLCVNGKANYSGVWELFTTQSNPLCNYIFLGYQVFDEIFCDAGTPIATISGFPVAPNDVIRAQVNLIGPSTQGAAYREFLLYIDNVTQNKAWSTSVWTNRQVPLSDIVGQGGAIVEDSPSCTVWEFFHCAPVSTNGLADFSTPIDITDVNVLGGTGGYTYTNWIDPLAFNGPLTVVHTGPSITEFEFNVQWERQEVPLFP